MNGWEGQVIAIAVKELFDAVKTLGREGLGRRDSALLSGVIRDLLGAHPNVTRAEAALKAIQAMGAPPSADLFTALRMLDAVKKTRLMDTAAARTVGTALMAQGSGQEGFAVMPRGTGTGIRGEPAPPAARTAWDRTGAKTRRDNS